jgi:hypothetical protein
MEKKLKILNFYLKEETITKLLNCQMNLNPLSNKFLQTRPLGPILVLIAIWNQLGIGVEWKEDFVWVVWRPPTCG